MVKNMRVKYFSLVRQIICWLILCTGIINVYAANTADWMKSINDNILINQIIMPGSHDAGMSEARNCAPPVIGPPLAKTQDLNFFGQVEAGSRYYDIRADYDKNQLTTYHRTDAVGSGWGCSGQTLNSLLDQAVDFLKKHDTEVIILKMSHTRSSSGHNANDTTKKVIELIAQNKYQPYLFKSSNAKLNLAEVALKDVRGKLIITFDSEYQDYIEPNKGIFKYLDGTGSAPSINIYDQYSDEDNYEKMKNDQINKFYQNGGLGNPYLFLLSWTLTSKSGSSIKTLANKANHELSSGLKEIYNHNEEHKLPNIVYIDFVTSELAETIIQYNFPPYVTHMKK